jgi:hypothetical protein
MISRLILEFDGISEEISGDELYTYSGPKDFESLRSLQALVDTRESSLTALADQFPNLEKFRLNNSIIPTVRDIGCSFEKLRFLWLPRCGLTSLDGICTLSRNLEELYLAFNQISDMSDLMGMNKLKVLDLEDNKIQDLTNVQFLTCCSGLQSLTLAGNPCTFGIRDYAREIARLVPHLVYLDETRIREPEVTPPEPSEFVPRGKPSSEQRVRPPAGVPSLRFPRSRPAEDDDDDDVIFTEFVDDQIRARPPTARGTYDISIAPSPRKPHPDSMLKSYKSGAIVRPLATARRVTVK